VSADRQAAVVEALPPPPRGSTRAGEGTGRRRSSRTTLDFVLVVVSSLVLTGVFLYLLQLWDVIHFTGRARAIGAVPNYLYYHLRSSIFFFTTNLLFFLFSLRALALRLNVFLDSSIAIGSAPQADRNSRLASIYSLDTRTDMAITTFFGIGVIYTAIGMESALVTSLGGIRGAEDAARQGAWEILRKLVDGGLILALSTTICGGIGGYALRLLKHAVVGRRLTLLGVEQDAELEALLANTNRGVAEIRDMLQAHNGAPPR
jgi:hypothetical protein